MANKGTRMKFSSEYEPDLRRLVIDAPNAVADLDIDIDNHYPNLRLLEITCKELEYVPQIPRTVRARIDIQSTESCWFDPTYMIESMTQTVERLELTDLLVDKVDLSRFNNLTYVQFTGDVKEFHIPVCVQRFGVWIRECPKEIDLTHCTSLTDVAVLSSTVQRVVLPSSVQHVTVTDCDALQSLEWMEPSTMKTLRIAKCPLVVVDQLPTSLTSLVVVESPHVDLENNIMQCIDLKDMEIGTSDIQRISSIPPSISSLKIYRIEHQLCNIELVRHTIYVFTRDDDGNDHSSSVLDVPRFLDLSIASFIMEHGNSCDTFVYADVLDRN